MRTRVAAGTKQPPRDRPSSQPASYIDHRLSLGTGTIAWSIFHKVKVFLQQKARFFVRNSHRKIQGFEGSAAESELVVVRGLEQGY